jgi:hypothetical protein
VSEPVLASIAAALLPLLLRVTPGSSPTPIRYIRYVCPLLFRLL